MDVEEEEELEAAAEEDRDDKDLRRLNEKIDLCGIDEEVGMKLFIFSTQNWKFGLV